MSIDVFLKRPLQYCTNSINSSGPVMHDAPDENMVLSCL